MGYTEHLQNHSKELCMTIKFLFSSTFWLEVGESPRVFWIGFVVCCSYCTPLMILYKKAPQGNVDSSDAQLCLLSLPQTWRSRKKKYNGTGYSVIAIIREMTQRIKAKHHGALAYTEKVWCDKKEHFTAVLRHIKPEGTVTKGSWNICCLTQIGCILFLSSERTTYHHRPMQSPTVYYPVNSLELDQWVLIKINIPPNRNIQLRAIKAIKDHTSLMFSCTLRCSYQACCCSINRSNIFMFIPRNPKKKKLFALSPLPLPHPLFS